MKKIIIVTLMALTPLTSHAWGDREQGLVTGAAVILLGQQFFSQNQNQNQNRNQPIYREVPVYVERPVYIERSVMPLMMCNRNNPEDFVYDAYGRIAGRVRCN